MEKIVEVLKYVFLGFLQGFTEVLPVSSSGHLIIAQNILGINDDSFTFEIFLHLASLIAILFFMRKRLWQLIKGFYLYVFKKDVRSKKEFKYIIMLIIATIPITAIALILKDFLDHLTSLWIVGLALFINGIMLYFVASKDTIKLNKELDYKDALVIGTFQAFGLFPGISRSGSCLSGAFTRNVSKEVAADFAFLLFIPAVLGATILKIDNLSEMIFNSNIILYSIAFFCSIIATYYSFKILLKMIRNGKLKYFAYYCLLAGFIVFIYAIFLK